MAETVEAVTAAVQKGTEASRAAEQRTAERRAEKRKAPEEITPGPEKRVRGEGPCTPCLRNRVVCTPQKYVLYFFWSFVELTEFQYKEGLCVSSLCKREILLLLGRRATSTAKAEEDRGEQVRRSWSGRSFGSREGL